MRSSGPAPKPDRAEPVGRALHLRGSCAPVEPLVSVLQPEDERGSSRGRPAGRPRSALSVRRGDNRSPGRHWTLVPAAPPSLSVGPQTASLLSAGRRVRSLGTWHGGRRCSRPHGNREGPGHAGSSLALLRSGELPRGWRRGAREASDVPAERWERRVEGAPGHPQKGSASGGPAVRSPDRAAAAAVRCSGRSGRGVSALGTGPAGP